MKKTEKFTHWHCLVMLQHCIGFAFKSQFSFSSNRFMDKRMMLKLNAGRTVIGILRGFDPFMNVVIDETVEECRDGTKNNIGMVVIRGNSIVLCEGLERI